MPATQATSTFLDYVTAFGAIATPLVVLLLTGVGWSIRNRQERIFKLEEKLRDNRIENYNRILEPFILFLMPEKAWESDPKNKNKNKNEIASRKMLSLAYREEGFKLSLIGTDDVVSAHNAMMQHFFKSDRSSSEESTKQLMRLLGQFLLEIRRSMGNEATKLSNWDMLSWFLTDIDDYRD